MRFEDMKFCGIKQSIEALPSSTMRNPFMLTQDKSPYIRRTNISTPLHHVISLFVQWETMRYSALYAVGMFVGLRVCV